MKYPQLYTETIGNKKVTIHARRTEESVIHGLPWWLTIDRHRTMQRIAHLYAEGHYITSGHIPHPENTSIKPISSHKARLIASTQREFLWFSVETV